MQQVAAGTAHSELHMEWHVQFQLLPKQFPGTEKQHTVSKPCHALSISHARTNWCPNSTVEETPLSYPYTERLVKR